MSAYHIHHCLLHYQRLLILRVKLKQAFQLTKRRLVSLLLLTGQGVVHQFRYSLVPLGLHLLSVPPLLFRRFLAFLLFQLLGHLLLLLRDLFLQFFQLPDVLLEKLLSKVQFVLVHNRLRHLGRFISLVKSPLPYEILNLAYSIVNYRPGVALQNLSLAINHFDKAFAFLRPLNFRLLGFRNSFTLGAKQLLFNSRNSFVGSHDNLFRHFLLSRRFCLGHSRRLGFLG